MPKIRLFRLPALLAGCVWLAGCQTMMPTAQTPYAMVSPSDAATPVADPWTWTDARPSAMPDNRETASGLVFGDAVMRPRPFVMVQREFHRAVAGHEAADALTQRLQGKAIRLDAFEASVGLWSRLSEKQTHKWEFVRVHLVVSVDGQRFEALDVHRFNHGDQPSPISIPLRNVVENIVQQMHLF